MEEEYKIEVRIFLKKKTIERVDRFAEYFSLSRGDYLSWIIEEEFKRLETDRLIKK